MFRFLDEKLHLVNVVEKYDMFKECIHEGEKYILYPLCINRIIVCPLDYPDIAQGVMNKIFIPYRYVNAIKEYLGILDITNLSIYGGYNPKDAIAKKILKKRIQNFLG